MGAIEKSAAALRFFGDDLDPDEITAALRVSPTTAAKKGGYWLTPGGREKLAHTGLWILEVSRRSPEDLDGQIEELLLKLTDDLSVWRDLAKRYQGDVFCGLFLETSNDGLDLNATTLAALWSRQIRLNFDIYAPPSGD